MNFRNHLSRPFVLVLVLVAIAGFAIADTAPCFAEGTAQCQARPACVADVTGLSKTADFLTPQNRSTVALEDFTTLHLIGDCCPNNNASFCPTMPGYSKVVCGFPMCSGGQLSCLYSN